MNKFIKLAVIFLFFLTGCTTGKVYEGPNLTASHQVATVSGFERTVNAGTWHNAKLIAIDNQRVMYNVFAMDDFTTKFTVLPGSHLFTIKTSFNNETSFFGTQGPYEAVASIQATLPAGVYYLNGSVEGAVVKLWIETAAGRVVSPIVSAPYARMKALI